MLIVISGTPGTGKTSVAKLLSRKMHAKLITTGYLVKKYKIRSSLDRKRKTKIIDTKKLSDATKNEAGKYKVAIFEGHLAHFTSGDLTVILRTNPKELEKRLRKKRWGQKKIRENVEAEAMGIISNEAGKSLEIDTTGKTPENIATLILKLLNNYSLRKRYAGKIDWTKEYVNYLKRFR